jgi:P27 family predicted phage terminase small subunit
LPNFKPVSATSRSKSVPITSPTKPPSDFDAASKAVWRTALEELQELGVWTDATAPLLELYCRALQTARAARVRIARRLKTDGDGAAFHSLGSLKQLVIHPDVQIARQAEADAAAYGRELLLSPGARQRSHIDGDDDALLDSLLGMRSR